MGRWKASDFEDKNNRGLSSTDKVGKWKASDFEIKPVKAKSVEINERQLAEASPKPQLSNKLQQIIEGTAGLKPLKTAEQKKLEQSNLQGQKNLLGAINTLPKQNNERIYKIPAPISFATGLADTATMGLISATANRNKNPVGLPQIGDNNDPVKDFMESAKTENPKSFTTGQIAGYFLPGTAIDKGVGTVFKGATKVLPKLANRALIGGTSGAAQELTEGVIRNVGDGTLDKQDLGNILKRTAIGGVFGAGADVALTKLGDILVKTKLGQNIFKKLRQGEELTELENDMLQTEVQKVLQLPAGETPLQLKEGAKTDIFVNPYGIAYKRPVNQLQLPAPITDVVETYTPPMRQIEKPFGVTKSEARRINIDPRKQSQFVPNYKKAKGMVEDVYKIDPQRPRVSENIKNNKLPFTAETVRPLNTNETVINQSKNNIPQSQAPFQQAPVQNIGKSNTVPNNEVYNEIVSNLDGVKTTADNNIAAIAPSIKDKAWLTLNLKDVYRNFRDAFGKNYDYVKQKYLDPFDSSKKAYVDEVKNYSDTIYNKVVKELGISKGSKESSAVQWYGEGNKVIKGIDVPYTLDDLKREFPDSWEKIAEADSIFRQQYDGLIDKINASRSQIYNNSGKVEEVNQLIENQTKKLEKITSPEQKAEYDLRMGELLNRLEEAKTNKLIPKRKDYYRHFNEMAEGFQGLKNIFDTPSQIDPKLAGISEFLKPKSKWLSFAQRRGKGEYTADAVGGFLDYIQPAAYSIHIDPHINSFRQLAKDIADNTAETQNANNTIKWLNDFTNNLAGKTNKYDRVLQEDIPGGRTTLRVINWLNGRVKANQILFSARSAVSQLANVPVGVARIKNPIALSKGVGQTLAGIAGKGNATMKESQFINERYMQHLIDRFDTGILKKPKQLAAWIMEGADKLGTQFTWNSAYNKAIMNSIKNPVKYADDLTRSVVAGRGIGEVPLLQQSKTFQIIAPFQLEVANLWHVMGDSIKEKDFGAIALLMLGNYMFNNVVENTTGSRVTFDPIDAMVDALSEEDKTPLKVGGRLAGEILSNIPLGQTLAAQYPEYGADISSPIGDLKISLPSRKELFGRNDPTRFGSGLLITKAFTDPLYKVALPFGGGQLGKTIQGVSAVNKGMVESNGKMSFPIEKNTENYVKAGLFGKYGTPEAKEYFDNNRRPLSEKQTTEVMAKPDINKAYDTLMKTRSISTQVDKIKKDTNLTQEEKTNKILELQRLLAEVKKSGK